MRDDQRGLCIEEITEKQNQIGCRATNIYVDLFVTICRRQGPISAEGGHVQERTSAGNMSRQLMHESLTVT